MNNGKNIELEKTYLLKYLPEGLDECESKEIIDIYIPKSFHPCLRIRKNGNKYEITKKYPINNDDSSEFHEHNIALSEEEFECLRIVDGKLVSKIRYKFPYEDKIAEIDIFREALSGLALIDFEFESREEMDNFIMPDFCLAEVTQERAIAGGFLAGKKYDDIKEFLDAYKYNRLG